MFRVSRVSQATLAVLSVPNRRQRLPSWDLRPQLLTGGSPSKVARDGNPRAQLLARFPLVAGGASDTVGAGLVCFT